MSAKIYSMEDYKKQKMITKVKKNEKVNILVNVVLTFGLAFGFSALVLANSFQTNRYQLICYLVSLVVIVFSCIHIAKVISIFKDNQLEKYILYFENYQMFITILASFAALFCLVTYGSWLFKLITFPLFAGFVTWNIIHTVKTVKKTPDLVERRL